MYGSIDPFVMRKKILRTLWASVDWVIKSSYLKVVFDGETLLHAILGLFIPGMFYILMYTIGLSLKDRLCISYELMQSEMNNLFPIMVGKHFSGNLHENAHSISYAFAN